MGLRDSICIQYLDNIPWYGKSFDVHLDNLRTVLCQLKSYRVKLKTEKYVFFKKDLKCLGKIISEDGCRDSFINTGALETLCNPPKTIGDLQKLLGFFRYYRQLICDFFKIAKLLYDTLCVPKENISPKSEYCLKKVARTAIIEWKNRVHKISINEKFIEELKSPKTIAYPFFCYLLL